MVSFAIAIGMACFISAETGDAAPGAVLERIPGARWRFAGELGARIDRNAENWLLRMPGPNPGLIEMFHRRDRRLPYAEPVPWAGEFAGKYLISAVQACRMSDDPRLKPFVQSFVDQLCACQAENGYLGPWPEEEQLLGHWDLWGHYHCMLGLLMWYDDTGDEKARQCVLRAADLISTLYGEGGRRPIEAGTPAINLSVIHIMAEVYRRTGDPRYMAVVRRIEEDLPKDGDWLRKGAEGTPYYELPGLGPRWESLHIVQGFATLYEITGDERYKRALLSLWDSIRQYDRHPSGAFSTNEQASGTIFAQGPIETCCSVAWMALTVDALRLSGDPAAADELELTLWNQALAAQHPSGGWCTYDTPLNGIRAPSYHQINFQYRPGTPELNCCSVNSPRTLGMLADWAVMRDADGLAVNFYGPLECEVSLRNGARVRLLQKTDYPVDGRIRIELYPQKRSQFTLRLRIPLWSRTPRVTLNSEPAQDTPEPGAYFALNRRWKKGDAVELDLDVAPRYQVGEGPDRAGRAAIHAGPLLLAFDAYYNVTETPDLAPINARDLRLERVPAPDALDATHFPPMGLWKVQTAAGESVLLCDFASAGAHGTDYAAWLPVSHVPPPAAKLTYPEHEASGAPGPVLFQWTASGEPDAVYELTIARDPDFRDAAIHRTGLKESRINITKGLEHAGVYFWKVSTRNEYGATENAGGPRAFRVDSTAGNRFLSIREDGLLFASPLDGNGTPSYGVVSLEEGLGPAADRFGRPHGAVRFAGPGSRLRYKLPYFPERDYTFMAWACPEGLPSGGQQIFSAWSRGMDDPLRVMVNGEEVSARIEAGNAYATPGARVENGKWVHVAAVKKDVTLTLFINGKALHSTKAPEVIHSRSAEVGVGFNPLFSGGEYFTGRVDDCALYARALEPEEIKKAYMAARRSGAV